MRASSLQPRYEALKSDPSDLLPTQKRGSIPSPDLLDFTIYQEMNRFRAIAIFTGGLALTTANLQAGPTVAATAGDPYSPIVARNVFGLNPAPSIAPARQDSAPPPKITLSGITTVIGPAEALFTVAGATGMASNGKINLIFQRKARSRTGWGS